MVASCIRNIDGYYCPRCRTVCQLCTVSGSPWSPTGVSEIKALREGLERLKEENRSLKTEGAQRLYREKAILKMKREVSLFKESNDRLMLEVESLKNQLKTK